MNFLIDYYNSFFKILLEKIKIFSIIILLTVSSNSTPAQTFSLISSCSDFVSGVSANWPYVLVATTIDSGLASQGAQTFTLNVTSLPPGGASFRVYKTVANGNDFFGNQIPLVMGVNTITVPAVNFDRAVKFQFSSGFVEFNALSLNGVSSICVFQLPTASTSLISSCSDFVSGVSANWPYVLVATTIDSGLASQGAQTFTLNVTSLPPGGASFRVYKTVANGNDFFGNQIPLVMGVNTITVPAVNFDRAVKFQFSSGFVEFNALSLNGINSECVDNSTSYKTQINHLFLNIFPNPSNGYLFIESNDPVEFLEITDLSGRTVLKSSPKKRSINIDVSKLKNYFYVLNCFINRKWVRKKIIIN